MVRLYMDENVHSAITREVRKRGVDVVTVQEDNPVGAAQFGGEAITQVAVAARRAEASASPVGTNR